jgi:RNA polymerase sigma factor (sigma-70 family)
VAALRRPPEEGRAPRPWLASVVCNFARERLRQDGGRRERERRAAGKGERPPTDELLEKLETQRVLAEAVGRLSEPYRTTILLRDFEELSAAEIARRQGVPAATVRSRLQRGLAELRERLDGHFGDRRAWGLALGALLSREGTVGALGAAVGGGTTTLSGVLVMNALVKTALVAAVLLFASAGVFLATREPQAAASAAAPAAAREQVALASLDAVEAAAEAEEETSFARVEGRCVDEYGAPLAGAVLQVVDDMPFHESDHGASGEVALDVDIEWESRVVQLAAARPGRASSYFTARLHRGESTHLGDIVLAPGGSASGRVRFRDGRPAAGALVQVTEPERRWNPETARRRGPEMRERGPETRTDASVYFEVDGVAAGFVRVWAGIEGMRFSFTDPVEVRAGERSDEVELVLTPLETEDVIEGVVLDPEGNGVETSVRYEWQAPGRSGSASLATDAEGFFSLKLPARVPFNLTAVAPEDGWGDISIADVPPGTLDVVFQFEPARQVTLRVRGADGEPVERFGAVVLNSPPTEWLAHHGYQDRPQGELAIDLPTVPFLVPISARGHAEEQVGPLLPADVDEVLEIDLWSTPGVHGRVTHRGEPVPGARVELRKMYGGTSYATYNGYRLLFESWSDMHEVTDAEGRFALTVHDDDRYVILVQADGFALGPSPAYDFDPAVGARGIEVELFRGGAIEGRVKVDRGRDPSGTIVGFNRGDGKPRTLRVGPDGRFRLEGLTPGGWQVVHSDEEINPNTSSTSIASGDEEAPLEWDCIVYEGETTFHDLDLREKKACHLAGTFEINGRPAVGWSARLELHAPVSRAQSMPSAAVGADGAFSLSVPEPSEYDLVLERPYELGRMELQDTITLEPGAQTWTLDLDAGALEGENAPTVGAGELAVRYSWRGPERGIVFSAQFHGDALGRFSLPVAPAGVGALQRHTSTLEEGWTTSHWEKLLDVDVKRDETQRVVLP